MIEIFFIFLRLGCISFGGPAAHLSYFQHEFVQQRKWLNEKQYANFAALCQFLPGPSSSQTGMCLGYERGGYFGMIAAWIGFTLPSALIMYVAALWLRSDSKWLHSEWLHGLKIVAVAVVAHAVLKMFISLCPDGKRRSLMSVTAIILLLYPSIMMQIILMLLCGVLTFQLYPMQKNTVERISGSSKNIKWGLLLILIFLFLLVSLPIINLLYPTAIIEYSNVFFQSGALVFGGGHVVLPFMQAYVVPPGWVSTDDFLAGYSIAQAVPGPMFSFAMYLGALLPGGVSPFWNGMLALVMVYVPSFLLLGGMMPFWQNVSENKQIQVFMSGVNAAVVGILFAAWINPVITQSISNLVDVFFALGLFLLMYQYRMPSWCVVILGIVYGFIAV